MNHINCSPNLEIWTKNIWQFGEYLFGNLTIPIISVQSFVVQQEGEDRAKYGKQLLKGGSKIWTERLSEGWSVGSLKKCRKFYQIYSANRIRATLSTQFKNPQPRAFYKYACLFRIFYSKK